MSTKKIACFFEAFRQQGLFIKHCESKESRVAATQKSYDQGARNRDALAELVANGAGIAEAGRTLGFSETTAFKHWSRIKRDLMDNGWCGL